jgi:hypothetical protein
MENKINVAEILKLCPTGMKLNCTMYDNVFFDKIDENIVFAIRCYTINNGIKTDINFTSFGTCTTDDGAKCVIFPEGKTTWKDFVPLCNFKDGDIVSSRYGNPFILKAYFPKSDSVSSYCALDFDDNFQEGCNKWASASGCRYATEEEKQKLFDAIKANGYKWNAETKILEKLEDVDDKGNISDGYHTFNELYEYRLLYNASMFNELAKQGLYDVHKSKRHSDGTIPFGDENWFIVQAELPTGQISNHYEMKEWDLFNIPEKEKANTYDGHTPQDVAKRLRDFLSLEKLVKSKFKDGDIISCPLATCIFKKEGTEKGTVDFYCGVVCNEFTTKDINDPHTHFGYIAEYRLATEEEKEKLFNTIKENGYRWNNESKTLEKLIVPKFKVGDRVKHKQSFISGVITNIDDDCYKIKYDSGAVSFAIIKHQDDWELVSDEIEPKFKVEDKIRLKGNPNYIYTITGIKENKSGCGVTFDLRFSEQDKNWNWFPKFDISTLKPFKSEVLVRDSRDKIWKPAIFGCFAGKASPYCVLGGICWKYCIPYEGNEHLCGKTDDCDEYYKTWE